MLIFNPLCAQAATQDALVLQDRIWGEQKSKQGRIQDSGRVWEGSPRAPPSLCPQQKPHPHPGQDFTLSWQGQAEGSCHQFTADTPGCGNTLFIRSIFHLSNTVTEYHNAGYKQRMAPWAPGEEWGGNFPDTTGMGAARSSHEQDTFI